MKASVGMAVLLIVAISGPSLGQMSILPDSPKASPEKPRSSSAGLVPLSKKLRICLDRQAVAVATKRVDLETASVAVMARCTSELNQIRNYILTGIPNFSPGLDYWEKDIEPIYMKEARKAVALARTRDVPPPVQAPAAPGPRVPGKNEI